MHTWRQRSTWSRTVGAVRARLEDAAPSAPLPSDLWRPLAANPLPYAGLATTLAMEYDYAPRIEGHLPPTLQGTLYRNGPGRFDRGGLRKRMLLDGDGMLQVYQFHQGQVRFRTRFVRTPRQTRSSVCLFGSGWVCSGWCISGDKNLSPNFL